ncbi:MAG: hypothetical protein QOI86_3087 [Actinomycetota bacterium]|jgi:hypothetical protein|nr:hypothetical protein [Actinomycetota bacterium]
MSHRITGHIRRNAVGYLALAASISLVGLKPGDGPRAASAKPTVTRFQLADQSRDGSYRHGSSRHGSSGDGSTGDGSSGDGSSGGGSTGGGSTGDGSTGDGSTGGGSTSDSTATSTTSAPSSGNIGARAHGSSVVAKHGGSTDVPLTGDSWTQSPQELDLVAGTMDVAIPASCTGGFANALTLSVDGKATTFAAAPGPPASGTLTVPFLIGTLSEPGQDTQHKLSAKFANSCTKNGEDFTIKALKVDVLKFR